MKRRASLSVSLTMALAACGSQSDGRTDLLASSEYDGGVSLFYVRQKAADESVGLGLGSGRFRWDRGCLVLDASGLPHTPIFPAAPRLSQDRNVLTFGSLSVRMGELVSFMGGPSPNLPARIVARPNNASACPPRFVVISGFDPGPEPRSKPLPIDRPQKGNIRGSGQGNVE